MIFNFFVHAYSLNSNLFSSLNLVWSSIPFSLQFSRNHGISITNFEAYSEYKATISIRISGPKSGGIQILHIAIGTSISSFFCIILLVCGVYHRRKFRTDRKPPDHDHVEVRYVAASSSCNTTDRLLSVDQKNKQKQQNAQNATNSPANATNSPARTTCSTPRLQKVSIVWKRFYLEKKLGC